MSRPLYESETDRVREKAAIERLLAGTDKTFRKLPIKYEVDYAILKDGEIVSWAEVKCRNISSSMYPTMLIGATKIWKGSVLSIHTGKPFFVVVAWTDKIGYLKVENVGSFELSFGGRTDRGDELDIEPKYYIPIDMFKMKE